MEIVIGFSALLLIINAALFIAAYRRNHRIAHERQSAALKAYVRSQCDAWTEADGR